MKKIIKNLLFYSFMGIITAIILYYFIFSKDGLLDFIKNNHHLNITWILLACLFQILNLMADVKINHTLLSPKFKQVNMWESLKTAMIGQFFNYVTPSSTGGQPMQIYYLSRINVDVGYSTSVFLQKLLVWQVSCMIYGSSIFIFNFNVIKDCLKTPLVLILSIAGLLIQILMVLIIVMCSLNKGLIQKISDFLFSLMKKFKSLKRLTDKQDYCNSQIENFHKTSRELLSNPKLLIKIFGFTFLQLTFIYYVPYCLYRSFYLNGESAVNVISLQAFVNLVSSMIPLPGATGVAEISYDSIFAELFGSFIKPSTILWRLITYYGMIILTLPFVYSMRKKHPKVKGKDEV